jgi:hypothetical protein
MMHLSHEVRMPLPIWSIVTDSASHCTGRSLDPTPQQIVGKIIVFCNSEFKFLLMCQTFMLQGS